MEDSMSGNTSMDLESVIIRESLDFSSPWHFSDVILVVGNTKFHVHKCILSLWSPMFSTMFTSQFKERKAKEIPLPGKRADEMEVLLKLIYSSGTKQTVTEENYQFLLQLADEYQMDGVKSMCSEFVVKKVQVSNCLEYFKIAETFGLDDVTKKCHQDVRYTSSDDLEGSEHFNGFDPKLKVDICMKVIKELERTLEEYTKTCSGLIEKVYKKVFGGPYKTHADANNPQNIQRHIEEHRQLQSKLQRALAKAATSEEKSTIDPNTYRKIPFCFSCDYCISRVQELVWFEKKESYGILKGPLNALYALHCNNNVTQAKKRADKVKELEKISKESVTNRTMRHLSSGPDSDSDSDF